MRYDYILFFFFLSSMFALYGMSIKSKHSKTFFRFIPIYLRVIRIHITNVDLLFHQTIWKQKAQSFFILEFFEITWMMNGKFGLFWTAIRFDSVRSISCCWVAPINRSQWTTISSLFWKMIRPSLLVNSSIRVIITQPFMIIPEHFWITELKFWWNILDFGILLCLPQHDPKWYRLQWCQCQQS